MPQHTSRHQPLSSRARIYILASVIFLVLSFLVTAGAVVIVNLQQQDLLEEARQTADDTANALGESLEELLGSAEISDPDMLDAELQERLADRVRPTFEDVPAFTYFTLIHNGKTVYYYDQEGIERWSGDESSDQEGPNPRIDPETFEHPRLTDSEEEIPIPIDVVGADNQRLSYHMVYRLSPLRIESSIKETAQAIRRTSWVLVSLLLPLLLLGILMLARAMAHVVSLHDEAHRLDRLAQIGTLAAGLAHEVRNPLNAMNINLELVEDDVRRTPDIDPSAGELIAGVKREIAHLNRIVSNFLTYARPSKDPDVSIDLSRAVRDSLNALAPQMETRGVVCEVGNLPEGLELRIDPTAIHQALTNLLLNAAEAMDKPDKRIRIGAETSGHAVTLRIEDNGRGIPPGKIKQVFEVFYTDKKTGSGLGLPTARRMIEEAGGTLNVDSVAGQGTVAMITLPLAKKRKI